MTLPSGAYRTAAVVAVAFLLPPLAGQPSPPPLPTEGLAVQLPPVVVEGSNAPPWKYVAMPGCECLSRCSDSVTRDFLEGRWRFAQELRALIPDRFLVTHQVPDVIILTPLDRHAPKDELMQNSLSQYGDSVKFLPNLKLDDVDASAVFASLDEANFDSRGMATLPVQVAHLLQTRVPALPLWFEQGLVALYANRDLRAPPVTLSALKGLDGDLLPISELLRPQLPAPPGDRTAYLQRWRAECQLFCRWAVDPDTPKPLRDAFWEYADRSSREPGAPDLFEVCLQQGTDAILKRLADYRSAAANPLRLRTGHLPSPPKLKPRAANDDEVARLRGAWERLEIPYVRRYSATFLPDYEDRARRTLHRAYDQEDRDPRLVAEMGLCEVDAGNDDAALPLLEAAAANESLLRPRAAYELARLRYDLLRKSPAGARRFTAAEIAPITSPLRAAIAGEPPLSEAYVLLEYLCRRSGAPPNPADQAALESGSRLFPAARRLDSPQ